MAKGRGPHFGQKRPPGKARAVRGEVLMDDKTRRKVRRFRFRRLVTFLAVVGFVAGAIALYMSPALRVQRVEVTGTIGNDPQLVASLVDADGKSLLTADFSEAEARIRELPGVKDVSIERRFPQTLRVVVTERAPWGTWAVGGDVKYVIDDEGVVLEGVSAPEGSQVIRAPEGTPTLVAGDRVDTDAVALTRALLDEMPARLSQNMLSIEWTEAKGLTVGTDAGYTVVVGDSQNIDYKLAVWGQIEAEIGREAMSGRVLDLRFGDRPALQ